MTSLPKDITRRLHKMLVELFCRLNGPTIKDWHDHLGNLGIDVLWSRDLIETIKQPGGLVVPDPHMDNYDFSTNHRSVIVVPEEIADKMLVMGALP